MVEPGLGAIDGRVRHLLDRVRAAEDRAGIAPGTVRVVAVSKTKPAEAVIEAYRAGIFEFGENYVQEAESKAGSLPTGAMLHLVGGLQRNKARKAARCSGLISAIFDARSRASVSGVGSACSPITRSRTSSGRRWA